MAGIRVQPENACSHLSKILFLKSYAICLDIGYGTPIRKDCRTCKAEGGCQLVLDLRASLQLSRSAESATDLFH